MSPSLTAYVPLGKFCGCNLEIFLTKQDCWESWVKYPYTGDQHIIASILASSIPLVASKNFYHYTILLDLLDKAR